MAAAPVADARDNFAIIVDALQRLGGPQKSTSTSRMICCPLPEHGGTDNTPSLGIHMLLDDKIPLGFYHCFGCSGRGPWNKLAEITGMDKIQEWQRTGSVSETLLTPAIEDALLGESGLTFNSVKKKMRCEEARRWPIAMNWRGFNGQLINAVGGHIVNDERKGTVGVLFPVKINGRVRGGIKAVLEREGKERAYDNMRGTWTKDYGLFPYMYAAKILRAQKLEFVFLVEGPRDALRLVSLGIPALAILGATSMSDVKALLVANLGVSHVYVISDNDNGGDVMWSTVKKVLRKSDTLKVSRMSLPKKYDESGNLIKMDPGSMPKRIVRSILSALKEKHDFEPQT